MTGMKAIRVVTGGVVVFYILPVTIAQLLLGYGDVVEWLRRLPLIGNVAFWAAVAAPLAWSGVHYLVEWIAEEGGTGEYRAVPYLDGEPRNNAFLVKRKARRRYFLPW